MQKRSRRALRKRRKSNPGGSSRMDETAAAAFCARAIENNGGRDKVVIDKAKISTITDFCFAAAKNLQNESDAMALC